MAPSSIATTYNLGAALVRAGSPRASESLLWLRQAAHLAPMHASIAIEVAAAEDRAVKFIGQ